MWLFCALCCVQPALGQQAFFSTCCPECWSLSGFHLSSRIRTHILVHVPCRHACLRYTFAHSQAHSHPHPHPHTHAFMRGFCIAGWQSSRPGTSLLCWCRQLQQVMLFLWMNHSLKHLPAEMSYLMRSCRLAAVLLYFLCIHLQVH